MRIAHIIPTLSTYGGATVAALALGAAQSKLGNQVSFWSTGEDKLPAEFAVPNINTFLFERRWPFRWYRSPDLVKKLLKKINSFDLIEIHGVWEYTSCAAARAARRTGTPYIVNPTGVFMHPWRYKSLKKSVYLRFLGNRMLNSASCIHATSEIEAAGCREAGITIPITIVPNGIVPGDYLDIPNPAEVEEKWPILKDREVLLFLSRISPEKGLDQCLLAVKRLIQKDGHKDLLFVIAGPSIRGYTEKVKLLVELNGLKSNVFFPGLIQGREKLGLYGRSDLFVLPSYSENYGIVVAEAMACRTPVVTTTGTPWKELEETNTGRWVEPEKNALADAIGEILDLSLNEREEMGARAQALAFSDHTMENVARRMQTVYRCILQGKEIPLHPEPFVVEPGGTGN